MIADVDAEAVEAMAGVLGAELVVADVGEDASGRAHGAAALGAFGQLDILVNNAGVTHLPAALEEVERGGVRPGAPGERQVGLPDRAPPGAGDEGAGRGGDPEHRLDGRALARGRGSPGTTPRRAG